MSEIWWWRSIEGVLVECRQASHLPLSIQPSRLGLIFSRIITRLAKSIPRTRLETDSSHVARIRIGLTWWIGTCEPIPPAFCNTHKQPLGIQTSWVFRSFDQSSCLLITLRLWSLDNGILTWLKTRWITHPYPLSLHHHQREREGNKK